MVIFIDKESDIYLTVKYADQNSTECIENYCTNKIIHCVVEKIQLEKQKTRDAMKEAEENRLREVKIYGFMTRVSCKIFTSTTVRY